MKISKLLRWVLLIAALSANAQMPPNMAMPKPASAATTGSTAMTEGVVQSLDKSRGVVTLKHGEITNMAMPAMTMAFNVSDKKMLENVKTGDKVRFHVENVGNTPTVNGLEPSK